MPFGNFVGVNVCAFELRQELFREVGSEMCTNDTLIVLLVALEGSFIGQPVITQLIECFVRGSYIAKSALNLFSLRLMPSQSEFGVVVLVINFALTGTVFVDPADAPFTALFDWSTHRQTVVTDEQGVVSRSGNAVFVRDGGLSAWPQIGLGFVFQIFLFLILPCLSIQLEWLRGEILFLWDLAKVESFNALLLIYRRELSSLASE